MILSKLIEKNIGRFAMIFLTLNIFIELNTGRGIIYFLQLPIL